MALFRFTVLFGNELGYPAYRTSMISDHCAPGHAFPCLAGKWPSQNHGDEGPRDYGWWRTRGFSNQARDGDDNIAVLDRRNCNCPA